MINDFRILLFCSLAIFMAAGCTPKAPFPSEQHYPSSAMDVPFIPPRSKQCASTSIEMVSLYWQTKTGFLPKLSIQELDSRTLIPAKEGTLQIELVIAARTNGLIAYPLESYDALFNELEANHPVIVLVNRSFSWHPLWHYLPIIGYDEKQRIILTHFSDQPNEAINIATFDALWRRSENWGIILLPPSELPVSVSPTIFLHSVYAYEKSGNIAESIEAYKHGLIRWPTNTEIIFALGNAEYNMSHLTEAEKNYRKILALNPTHPLALNNLAMVLCRTHRSNEAIILLNQIVSDDPIVHAIQKASSEEIAEGCPLITF